MRLAARGRREDENGDTQSIDDRLFDEAARKQARAVTIKSVVTTVVITAIVMLLPMFYRS